MNEKSGFWIAVGGGGLAEKISYAIKSRWEFSYSVPAEDKPKRAELVVVSLYENPDYLGVSVKGRPSTTGQISVMITQLMPVKSLSPEQLNKLLPRKFQGRLSPPPRGVYRPTPKLWQSLLSILIEDTQQNKTGLAALQQTITDANKMSRGRRAGGLEVFERDAVASALQAWAGPGVRRRVLRNAAPAPDDKAPFLERLRNVPSREDPQINHDQTVFPGMTVAARDIVSSVTLTDGNERITILNCNRQPLEQTLGVDLIYYSHRFGAFTLAGC
jgi:hypothetical protein